MNTRCESNSGTPVTDVVAVHDALTRDLEAVIVKAWIHVLRNWAIDLETVCSVSPDVAYTMVRHIHESNNTFATFMSAATDAKVALDVMLFRDVFDSGYECKFDDTTIYDTAMHFLRGTREGTETAEERHNTSVALEVLRSMCETRSRNGARNADVPFD